MIDLLILGTIAGIALLLAIVVIRIFRPRARPLTFEQMTQLIANAKETMERWPKAEGRVIASRVIARRVYGRRWRISTDYEPRVEVRYKVNGKEMRALANAYSEARADRVWADNVVRRFPEGRRVDVRYDPERPHVAFVDLEEGGSR